MTTSARVNLNIQQGKTFNEVFTLIDNSGAAIDLTGMTARMKIKDAYTGALIKSLTSSDITTGGTTGTVTPLISATDTAAMDFILGEYDLEIVNGATVDCYQRGYVTFEEEVTT
jgi:hypothetical protein